MSTDQSTTYRFHVDCLISGELAGVFARTDYSFANRPRIVHRAMEDDIVLESFDAKTSFARFACHNGGDLRGFIETAAKWHPGQIAAEFVTDTLDTKNPIPCPV